MGTSRLKAARWGEWGRLTFIQNAYTDVGIFTTRTPAVTDVFVSGRNVGALRPARHVVSGDWGQGLADDISRGHNIFVMPTVPKLLKLGPNSKRGKCSLDQCAFFQCI